ncbi:hypothetical protein PV797_04910 [Clostridiaceae bacterium M8S5]|nr:hypothetical protein PV797_04910 [Clostridiaceae bacterium M8S5]
MKDEAKVLYQDLDEMLGNSSLIDVFTDGKARNIKPITLRNFSDFMSNVAIINAEKMWTNFIQDESAKAVIEVLKMSIDEEEDVLMDIINADNFPIIIKKILSVNGIMLNTNNDSEDDAKKKE